MSMSTKEAAKIRAASVSPQNSADAPQPSAPAIQMDPRIQVLKGTIESCITMEDITRTLEKWGWIAFPGGATKTPTLDGIRKIFDSCQNEKTISKKLRTFGYEKTRQMAEEEKDPSPARTPAAAPLPRCAAAAAAAPLPRCAAAAAAVAAAPSPAKLEREQKKAHKIMVLCEYQEDAERAFELRGLCGCKHIAAKLPKRADLPEDPETQGLTPNQRRKIKNELIRSKAQEALHKFDRSQAPQAQPKTKEPPSPKFLKLSIPPENLDPCAPRYEREAHAEAMAEYVLQTQRKIKKEGVDPRFLQLTPHQAQDPDKPKSNGKIISVDVRHHLPDPYLDPENWGVRLIRNRICDMIFVSAAGIGSHLGEIQKELNRTIFTNPGGGTQNFLFSQPTDGLTKHERIELEKMRRLEKLPAIAMASTAVFEAFQLEISKLTAPLEDERSPAEMKEFLLTVKKACIREIKENNFTLYFPAIQCYLDFKEQLRKNARQ